MDLIMDARREEQLIAVAIALQEQYKIKVQSICCDLASPDAVKKLLKKPVINKSAFLYTMRKLLTLALFSIILYLYIN